jgi:NADPH-dependent F420 reductase
VKVAVLGGTGAFGSALAVRLGEAGVDVTIGSRDPDRAAARAAELGVTGATNTDAVAGVDLVVLSVDASAALSTAAELADAIGETSVLSVASQLRFENKAALPSDDPVSLAERAQHLLRGPVVAGLHSLAAKELAAGKAKGDALVCGDEDSAKAAAIELASHLVSGRVLDAGPLASARALEAMTAVIVNLNRRYRGRAGLQFVGL